MITKKSDKYVTIKKKLREIYELSKKDFKIILLRNKEAY